MIVSVTMDRTIVLINIVLVSFDMCLLNRGIASAVAYLPLFDKKVGPSQAMDIVSKMI